MCMESLIAILLPFCCIERHVRILGYETYNVRCSIDSLAKRVYSYTRDYIYPNHSCARDSIIVYYVHGEVDDSRLSSLHGINRVIVEGFRGFLDAVFSVIKLCLVLPRLCA